MNFSGWGPVATILAALVAIVAVIITLVLQRRTAQATLEQVRRTADSAALSAAASDRSSQAAEAAVGVNRQTAAGVGRRAEADVLAQRYSDAATQLGSEQAAVRLAGAYAMARLADDWPEHRQSCVDVLCAYLRMPGYAETTQAAEGEKQVKSSILRLIGDHLEAGTAVNWSDCDLDFSYAELPRIVWSRPTFRKRPDFGHVRFTDAVLLSDPHFESGANFGFGRFDTVLQIKRARLSAGDLVLYGADIKAGVLTTDVLAKESTINLARTVCRGEFGVVCSLADGQPQGRVALQEVLVRSGGSFYLDGVDIDGAAASPWVVSAPGAVINVEPEGQVRLPPTFKEFSGRDVYNDVWKN
jgi:hypothetical protein